MTCTCTDFVNMCACFWYDQCCIFCHDQLSAGDFASFANYSSTHFKTQWLEPLQWLLPNISFKQQLQAKSMVKVFIPQSSAAFHFVEVCFERVPWYAKGRGNKKKCRIHICFSSLKCLPTFVGFKNGWCSPVKCSWFYAFGLIISAFLFKSRSATGFIM